MKKNIELKLLLKKTKPTSMRILVYEFLEQQQIALSLTEIENHFYNADRVTIYRTLKTFEKKGIVHSIQENTVTKYILCNVDCNEKTHNDWHLHFYCTICKQTTCKDDFLIPKNVTSAYKIDKIKLFGTGICENCIKEGQ
ncbi:transcriptional regulator [Myroides sp. JBRI-B21084]|uniref:Fur family transcriptional regulator n=1 Tax=Myroides sp. JBRI-B21084 TaxID=3119977 RepID=UPI0026E263EF|nr:transcriptional regulator [Paenimyroides cloacae]WKW45434.1 transcriptional regulator [Paenimyroides cloacae]